MHQRRRSMAFRGAGRSWAVWPRTASKSSCMPIRGGQSAGLRGHAVRGKDPRRGERPHLPGGGPGPASRRALYAADRALITPTPSSPWKPRGRSGTPDAGSVAPGPGGAGVPPVFGRTCLGGIARGPNVPCPFDRPCVRRADCRRPAHSLEADPSTGPLGFIARVGVSCRARP